VGAPGCLYGTTMGERYFNIEGKSFCFDLHNGFLSENTFNPDKKGFFSKKKHPSDYFTG
jgi:hypothetical protein